MLYVNSIHNKSYGRSHFVDCGTNLFNLFYCVRNALIPFIANTSFVYNKEFLLFNNCGCDSLWLHYIYRPSDKKFNEGIRFILPGKKIESQECLCMSVNIQRNDFIQTLNYKYSVVTGYTPMYTNNVIYHNLYTYHQHNATDRVV